MSIGLLGKDIFGTGFNFDITAPPRRGRVRMRRRDCAADLDRRQPRRAASASSVPGGQGPVSASRPIINNVETYANIPQIILKGAEWFASHGYREVQGNEGFRTRRKDHEYRTCRDPDGNDAAEKSSRRSAAASRTARNSRRLRQADLPADASRHRIIDTPIDYDNLIAIGSMMGSGGLIVMDEDTCMVDIAKFFLEFTVDESCGKCAPCRIGTRAYARDPQ